MSPTGGLATGGTLVTFSGAGFDGFHGAVNDTLCRWGNASDAATTSPDVLEPRTLVCAAAPSRPSDVDVTLSLNRIDYTSGLGLW